MSKGLNYFQAFDVMLTGKAVRRDAWHKWLTWEHWLGWLTQPAVDGLDAFKRIARNTDFTRAEFLAADWTDEPWDTAFPAPIVAPSTGTTSAASDASAGGAGSSGGSPPALPSAPSSPSVLWGISSGGGGGGGGGGGRIVPHDPPSSNPATVSVSYQTDLEPEGIGCLLSSQSGSGQTCSVIMTVAISGGPTGVFDLHIQLGSYTKSAESGYNGYTRDFSFDGVPVNPGGSLTPNVIYHPAGGDVTTSSPAFTFPDTCTVVTFSVRFFGTANFTMSSASGSGYSGTGTLSWDVTKSYSVAIGAAASAVSCASADGTTGTVGWSVSGGPSGSGNGVPPSAILADIAGDFSASNPVGSYFPVPDSLVAYGRTQNGGNEVNVDVSDNTGAVEMA